MEGPKKKTAKKLNNFSSFMRKVIVDLGARSYPVYIGRSAIDKIFSIKKSNLPSSLTPLFIITNSKINKIHEKLLKKLIRDFKERVAVHKVPDSETAKSFAVYIKTIKRIARFAQSTKPVILALGGGVVGDLSGFVASTYRRGIPFIQIPTTLLGQVDSAVGGKVAIDIPEAKNIIGSFYQPRAVLCDTRFIKTLPEKELRNGLAEVVKYGIIKDRLLFKFVESNLDKILKRDERALVSIIHRSCRIKADIVEKDEFDDKNIRNVLNFGHTFGHAVEAASSYSRSVSHGQAVAIGMLMASFMARRMGILNKADYDNIASLVKRVAPETSIKGLKMQTILNALSYDKKFVSGVNKFILPQCIGNVKIVDNIPSGMIKEAISQFK